MITNVDSVGLIASRISYGPGTRSTDYRPTDMESVSGLRLKTADQAHLLCYSPALHGTCTAGNTFSNFILKILLQRKPVTNRVIETISVRLVDEIGATINLRNETISLLLHLKRPPKPLLTHLVYPSRAFGRRWNPPGSMTVVPKPLDKRIGGTGKSVVEGLRQLPEVVLDGRHIQVTMQNLIPNIPNCVHIDPQTHALERLYPPHIRVRQVVPSTTRIVEDRSEQLLVQCQTVPRRQGDTPSSGQFGVQRKSQVLNTVRPSDLLSEQPEWGWPVELSFPSEEHCCALLHVNTCPPGARAWAFSWLELSTPLRPTIGGLGAGTHIKFLVMHHRDLFCTHRLSILSSQTLFRYSWTILRASWTLRLQLALSTGSLEICQAFLSRFFSWTCLRIESIKEAFGALLGRCLGVEASRDPLMAEFMNSAPRSISAAVRKVGVGPNLSLNTFIEPVPVSALKILQHQPPSDTSGDNEVEDVRKTKGIVREDICDPTKSAMWNDTSSVIPSLFHIIALINECKNTTILNICPVSVVVKTSNPSPTESVVVEPKLQGLCSGRAVTVPSWIGSNVISQGHGPALYERSRSTVLSLKIVNINGQCCVPTLEEPHREEKQRVDKQQKKLKNDVLRIKCNFSNITYKKENNSETMSKFPELDQAKIKREIFNLSGLTSVKESLLLPGVASRCSNHKIDLASTDSNDFTVL
uniref:Uncharacterized protein n=1 Tax=Timema tahoe TaxID=61484 RepID=A0A7R9NYF9_9NEOP|nr:unnamed protein product [Timema tahoe]